MQLQTAYRVGFGALMLALLVVGSGIAATQRTLVAPTITDFTPKTGGEGTKVTITGTGFAGAKVAFSGVAAAAVVVNGVVTSIIATVPAADVEDPPLPGPITVTTRGGTVSSTAAFTFGKAPASKAPPAQPVVRKYYTYKTQVILGAGQTLHFTTGRGYYAA